ncbi:MAG TPA: PLD nuclease N-terminal domain-containing protein [Micromonosporaceae bacterium]
MPGRTRPVARRQSRAGRRPRQPIRRLGSNVRWCDLTNSQRAALVTLAGLEAVLTAAAAADLYRRPGDQVRGPKAAWWPVLFVQPVGPVAYLRFGRRTGPGEPQPQVPRPAAGPERG